MGIRAIKPTTPANRFATRSDFSEITKSYPEKSLTKSLRKTGGRNNNGRITVRHRGGGHRRRYRIIDFKRDKFDVPAKVASIEYDPNRSANIALLHYLDGEKPKGIESTIIDLTKNEPRIARIGALYSTILEGMFES